MTLDELNEALERIKTTSEYGNFLKNHWPNLEKVICDYSVYEKHRLYLNIQEKLETLNPTLFFRDHISKQLTEIEARIDELGAQIKSLITLTDERCLSPSPPSTSFAIELSDWPDFLRRIEAEPLGENGDRKISDKLRAEIFDYFALQRQPGVPIEWGKYVHGACKVACSVLLKNFLSMARVQLELPCALFSGGGNEGRTPLLTTALDAKAYGCLTLLIDGYKLLRIDPGFEDPDEYPQALKDFLVQRKSLKTVSSVKPLSIWEKPAGEASTSSARTLET